MSKKKKSVADRLTYAYIRKIKRWMFCPACQNGKMTINKKSTMWTCEECGYQLSADEFEDDYVFWFCDECKTFLNKQEGFNRGAVKHICTECGFENDTTYINDDKELFRSLYERKAEIEADVGAELDWRELPEKKASRILIKRNANLTDEQEWPQQFDWVMDKLVKMKKAFKKYI